MASRPRWEAQQGGHDRPGACLPRWRAVQPQGRSEQITAAALCSPGIGTGSRSSATWFLSIEHQRTAL